MDPVSVLYVTKLSTNTGDLQGGGSNKDGCPELGYHNKHPSSACPHQAQKKALWSTKVTISQLAIWWWEKARWRWRTRDGVEGGRQNEDKVTKIKRCLSSAFILGFLGLCILFTSETIGRSPWCSRWLCELHYRKNKHRNGCSFFFWVTQKPIQKMCWDWTTTTNMQILILSAVVFF